MIQSRGMISPAPMTKCNNFSVRLKRIQAKVRYYKNKYSIEVEMRLYTPGSNIAV